MTKSFLLLGAVLVDASSEESPAFTDSGRFERWSHFKDYGVPGTVHDPVNKAAIADGTCRMVTQQNGNAFWNDAAHTQAVLDVLAAAPSTDSPSHFTLETKTALQQACLTSTPSLKRPDYDIGSVASSFQNWHHALCAPEEDPSWGGAFDPAYQPQQMALTTGFMCIVACDANGKQAPSAASMAVFASSDEASTQARGRVCHVYPWGSTDFSTATTLDELGEMSHLLVANPTANTQPCSCGQDIVSLPFAKSSPAFSDSGRFERWSHFKDYGVPGTVHDPVNKAAIADGVCRMLTQQHGYTFWHDAVHTQAVLDTLAAAPATDGPSHFTLETSKALRGVCSQESSNLQRPDYDIASVASSLQNWYHALCAPASDSSWGGAFDPAYQPQQIALTTGFMCIVACDANGSNELSSKTLAALASSVDAAEAGRDQVCAAYPWGSGTDFSKAATLVELGRMSESLLAGPCPCSEEISEYV